MKFSKNWNHSGGQMIIVKYYAFNLLRLILQSFPILEKVKLDQQNIV